MVELTVDQKGAGEKVDLGDVYHLLQEVNGVSVAQPDLPKVALNIGIQDSRPHGTEEVFGFRVKGGGHNSWME